MTDVRKNAGSPQVKTGPVAPKNQGPKTQDMKHEAPAHGHTKDELKVSSHAKDAHGDEEHDTLKELAHKVHNPHGALHAIEAGEKAVKVATRLVPRAASTVATGSEAAAHAAHAAGHHGIIGKFEHLLGKGLAKGGELLGKAVAKVPYGTKVANAIKSAAGAPGRAAGVAARAADGAIAGTKAGNAVRLAGSGGRFLTQIGGRIPFIGAALGGVIGYVDAKDAIKTLKDDKATTKEKVIAGSQGLLSAASGVLGVGALAAAGAVAVGLTAPVSVPLLLGAAAITGVGAFALSFFKKH